MTKSNQKSPGKKNQSVEQKPDASTSSKPGLMKWLFLFIILSATYFSYHPAMDAKLTNWDDDKYITENPAIKNLSGNNLKPLLTNCFEGNYHPLTMLSFAINYSQSKLDPAVYHRTNIFLHLLNTGLVFWLIILLVGDFRMAAIASALFGIHTLHVESVAWVSERKDVLYAFFYLLSLISYVYYLEKKNWLIYFIALVLFILSLLSKGMAVSLAISLFLIDYYKGRKLNSWKSIVDKIPFLILAFVFGYIAIHAQQIQTASLANEMSYPLYQRIIFAGFAFISYLAKLVYPYHLAIFYPYPVKSGDALPVIYFLFVLLATGLTAIILYSLKKNKLYFFGFTFFVLNILLVLQLISVGKAVMADRYTYVSSIGFFFMVASAWQLIKPPFKNLGLVLFVVYSMLLIYQTRGRCMDWHDSLSLWNDQVIKYPMHTDAWKNRGLVKGQNSDYNGAIADFNKVIELDSNNASAYTDRGMAKQLMKDTVGALNDYSKAISKNSKLPLAYFNKANLEQAMKNFKPALDDFNTAIQLNPGDANLFYERGRVHMNLNQTQEAIKDFTQSILLKPAFALAYTNRGLIRMNLKDNVNAMADYNEAIRSDPKLAVAYYNRGVLKFNSGDRPGACDDFKTARDIGNGDAVGLISLFCK